MARREKELMRRLRALDVGFYSPLVAKRMRSPGGRTRESFNAVERLCYTGVRGMGALEFAPATGPRRRPASTIDIDALVKLASELLPPRNYLHTSFPDRTHGGPLPDLPAAPPHGRRDPSGRRGVRAGG